mmetsp:Transcript_52756/g.115528  ORF Transcript_52756/g.115528 Transcript_52756/m.115528 type:complete len:207 (-) Transcript_52756:326-946(-)
MGPMSARLFPNCGSRGILGPQERPTPSPVASANQFGAKITMRRPGCRVMPKAMVSSIHLHLTMQLTAALPGTAIGNGLDHDVIFPLFCSRSATENIVPCTGMSKKGRACRGVKQNGFADSATPLCLKGRRLCNFRNLHVIFRPCRSTFTQFVPRAHDRLSRLPFPTYQKRQSSSNSSGEIVAIASGGISQKPPQPSWTVIGSRGSQ